MRSLKLCLLFLPLLLACETVLEPTGNDDTFENPVIIAHDQARETKTQMKWNALLTQYKAIPDTHHTHFMESTSFLMQTYFKEKLPGIVDAISVNQNDTNLVIQLRKFYSDWEDLFGCQVNSIEFNFNQNNDFEENETRIYRFQQKNIGNTTYRFIMQPFIEFGLSKNGELERIISTLIPDFEMKIPSPISNSLDISKMVANTMGYEHEFYADASSIYFPSKHLFSPKDIYKVKDGFEIYPKYAENTLSIFCLKGVEYFWLENKVEYKCTIYYHPATAEIIYVKKW